MPNLTSPRLTLLAGRGPSVIAKTKLNLSLYFRIRIWYHIIMAQATKEREFIITYRVSETRVARVFGPDAEAAKRVVLDDYYTLRSERVGNSKIIIDDCEEDC